MLDPDKALDAPPEVQLFRLLLVVGLQLRARMDHRFADIGLTTQQAALLTLAASATPTATLGELARALGCTHQNARQLVDALSRKGLVTVEPDPTDRRARRVSVTDGVPPLFADRDAADAAAIREWFGALSDAEVEVAVGMLRRVVARMG